MASSKWSNTSIWVINRILTGDITLGQSGLGSNGNEEVLHTPQSSLGNLLGEGARGVMVIVVGIGHGDMSSNPGRDWLQFTEH